LSFVKAQTVRRFGPHLHGGPGGRTEPAVTSAGNLERFRRRRHLLGGPRWVQAAAAAYLTAHSIPFDGLTPAVTVEDHGCCKFYVVTWQRSVNGVTVPDTRIVKLDPSNGTVFSFTDSRAAYDAIPSPKIGRDEAIRLASIAAGQTDPIVGAVELLSDGRPFWPGRLVWSVQLGERAGASSGAAIVYVDAITGEAKVVGRG
jgi:hypothetical protein